ncbi:FAD-dependent oxidoreductase [Calderihabitans maritimus]|uniref:FAD-dependent oxidoreductase n=1 Tax=Calderihabitans maritimus TaxID=1246530 RepID=UPI001864A0C3|nr:FAD-dependent oxidoreductase [Calderihabitans maritimus]
MTNRFYATLIIPLLFFLFFTTGCTVQNEINPGPAHMENKNSSDKAETAPHLTQINYYDLIVVGGEPEGVAAAVSGARSGLSVLLIEDDRALGGLITLGKLSFLDMNYGKDGTLLTRGIFKEFYDAVGGTVFDVEKAKKVFTDMVEEQDTITLKLNTSLVEPIKDGNNLIGVRVREGGEIKEYYGKRFIDATADADLAAPAGVPYTIGREDIGEKEKTMGVTLVFELTNVNWPRIVNYLRTDGDKYSGAGKRAAWGYKKEGYSYEPKDPGIRLRGFNIARQDNGNVLINALIIFGVDVFDPESRQKAIARARRELEYLMPYIRENFAGFENAELVGTAEQLYVRESRHIIGEYQLTIDDVLENRDHWDRIAIGSYPVDIQPSSKDDYGFVLGNPDRYSIPFRSLVPLKIENLLVVGRSASYTSLAAGSARVIPVGMCEGEAAGVAAAYSIKHNISFREMTKSEEAIKSVQEELVARGAYLEPFNIKDPLTDHWAYEGVKTLRRLGLVKGGYNNDYGLNEKIDKWFFQTILNESLKKAGSPPGRYIEVSARPANEEILKSVAFGLGKQVETVHEAREILSELGILTDELKPYFTDNNKRPNKAEVIMLVANLYKYCLATP